MHYMEAIPQEHISTRLRPLHSTPFKSDYFPHLTLFIYTYIHIYFSKSYMY